MFKENDEARREVNLDIWHAAGYDGEGLNILLCDLNGVILPHMKEYCILVDPKNKMLKVPKHNTYTAQVLHEALPKAKIYVAPWTHSSKEISDWLDANPGLIHMANVSLSSPVSDAYDVFKRHNILVCCSSGNDSKRTKYGVSFPADLPWTIAFGAYNWRDKSLYANDVVSYSNGGEDLDAVSCTNIKVQNDRGKLFDYTGTSTASPWGCCTLGAYVCWRLKHGLPVPTQGEAKEYIHKSCIDLREKGFDYDSGYGLFCLPKEIPELPKEGAHMDKPGIKWIGSPNFSGASVKQKTIAIANHIMQGTLAGTDSWFLKSESMSSAHFGVGKNGEIHQYVSLDNPAWANGSVNKPTWPLLKSGVNPNYYTVSIEHEGYSGDVMPEAQYQATLALHRWLIELLGIVPGPDTIIGHYRIDSVNKANCPGSGFPWDRLFKDLKEEDDVLDVAILKHSAEDEWAAKDIDAQLGGVANFTRQGSARVIPAAALKAKKLIIIGGPDVPEHPNRVYLSGKTKYDTAAAVGKYLG